MLANLWGLVAGSYLAVWESLGFPLCVPPLPYRTWFSLVYTPRQDLIIPCYLDVWNFLGSSLKPVFLSYFPVMHILTINFFLSWSSQSISVAYSQRFQNDADPFFALTLYSLWFQASGCHEFRRGNNDIGRLFHLGNASGGGGLTGLCCTFSMHPIPNAHECGLLLVTACLSGLFGRKLWSLEKRLNCFKFDGDTSGVIWGGDWGTGWVAMPLCHLIRISPPDLFHIFSL